MAYPPAWTPKQIADQLTRTGRHWTKKNLTISFNDKSTSGYGLDSNQIAAIQKAVAGIAQVFDLTFTVVGSGGDITFNGANGGGTHASSSYYPSDMRMASSNIYFDQTWTSNQASGMQLGGYGLTTIIHEFLHALGLSHPGDYDGSANYLTDAVFLQDTHRYSVMSYFNAYEDGSGTSHYYYNGSSLTYTYPQTMMVYDILAMTKGAYGGYFSGYGLNTSTRSGSTTYGYNASGLGSEYVYNFDVNQAPVLTIYDAGGYDVLDLSGDTIAYSAQINYDSNGVVSSYTQVTRTSSVIDLRQGAYSSTHGMANNIGIAFGTIIESAIGTKFNDLMYGNEVNNFLDGRLGNDTLFGFAGNDTFSGGSGTNTLDGGSGRDVATYAFSSTQATITRLAGGSWRISYGGIVDTLTNVEIARFADRSIAIREAPKSDFDGSNVSDILWRSTAGTVVTWSMANNARVGSTTLNNPGGNWSISGIGDFNGDGTADILWRNTNGTVVTWNIGNGARTGSTVVAVPNHAWSIAGVGDFNGDGTTDILWRNTNGTVVTWEMQNGGRAGSTVVALPDNNWSVAGVGDFNGDGTDDIVWRNGGGTVVTWSMHDGARSGSTVVAIPDNNWSIAGVGDFNGDGNSDLLWRHANGTIVTWAMKDGNRVGSTVVGTIASGWSIAGAGDFNGDGTADILWRHANGTVAIWQMGNGVRTAAATVANPGSNWQIA